MTFARIVRAALAVAAALVATGLVTSPATARAAAGCDVAYVVTDQWRSGFGARVTLTNLGDPLPGWTLEWEFTAGQRITSETWNGVFSQSGSAVRVKNTAYNGALATGRSVTVGFNGAWSGSNPAPTSFSVDGVPCTGAPVTADTTSDAPEPTSAPPLTTAPSATTTTTTSTTTSTSSSSSSATTTPSESSAASGAAFTWPTASPKPAVVLSADVSPDSGVDALRLGLVISLLVASVGIAVLLVVRRHLRRAGDPGEQP
ncbi:cellulose-binding domain-containing protein [Saccharothrix texasensis]|uniref:Cellulose binding domain-containing protein n=1 Tax=Saccharothrix texasensis TaxID=103734 RepID=A0A3N1HEW6_9PSEU|nr:cellulose-binding domain-containing protein [Saccharothrix texasensis]ROP40822.1 cellulose binding domain-containing protein [Saccharothrix texasensis]